LTAEQDVPQENAQGWELVTLGVSLRGTKFCICCMTFRGVGMRLGSTTHCMACWQKRQKGDPCFHGAVGELRQAG
jgi:hypothetical protein